MTDVPERIDIAADAVVEQCRMAETLAAVGPEAATGIDAWTAADLAAHMRSQLALRGFAVFPGRWLVARGLRLNDVAHGANDRMIATYRRRGFSANVARLRDGIPRLLLRPEVAAVTLFETWLHHDDLCRANGIPHDDRRGSLDAAVDFAARYQRTRLGGAAVERSEPSVELLRWLGGRPSSLPPHEPPLRI